MGTLRELTVSQQVGLLFVLLFVLLFGGLAIVTALAFGQSLRERSDEQLAGHVQFKRDLRAVWVGALLFWLSWALGAFVSTLLFGAISFLALRGFVTLTHTRRADHRSLLLAFFSVLPLQYGVVATRHFDLFTVFIRSVYSSRFRSSAPSATTRRAFWSAPRRSSGASRCAFTA